MRKHLEHAPNHALRCHPSQRLALRAHAREIEQVADQTLHALGAIDRVVDVLVGFCVELALVALLEQPGVAGHHAQRFLQIVRGDVGKLLELGVAAAQIVLGALVLGDVDDRGQGRQPVGHFDWTQTDFDGDFAAVLAQGVELAPAAHRPRVRVD